MASPHVAGLGAYILGLEGKKTPAALSARLTALSLRNKITGLPSGTVNYLAFNGNPSGKSGKSGKSANLVNLS